jgi:hypothetical protein
LNKDPLVIVVINKVKMYKERGRRERWRERRKKGREI